MTYIEHSNVTQYLAMDVYVNWGSYKKQNNSEHSILFLQHVNT